MKTRRGGLKEICWWWLFAVVLLKGVVAGSIELTSATVLMICGNESSHGPKLNNENNELPCQLLLKFDDLLDNAPPASAVGTAILELTVEASIRPSTSLYRLLKPWDSSTTWINGFGGDGIQSNGIEAEKKQSSYTDATQQVGRLEVLAVDVTADVFAWLNGDADNYGWVFIAKAAEVHSDIEESWVAFSGSTPKLRILESAQQKERTSRRMLQHSGSACFDVNLFDSHGDGWDGASYNILALDGTIVVNGTMQYGVSETHEVCVVPACYTMIVSSGSSPDEISWRVGYNGEISGAAPAKVEFYVFDDGHVMSGSCAAAPSISSVPTTSLSPRTLIDTANCSGNGCAMSINLHTASFAEYISSAYLAVDLQSPEYTVIAINEVDEALYGNRDISSCTESVRYINNLDVTTEARQKGVIKVSFIVPQALISLRPCDNFWPDNSIVLKRAMVTVVATLSETSYPSFVPSVSSISTHFPTINAAPSITPIPTIVPTSAISTYNGLKSALESDKSLILVNDIIIFLNFVTIEDVQVKITSDDKGTTFDGTFSTSLLDLTKSSLTLEQLTIRRGYGLYFGCIRATMSQISIFDSSLVNCTSEISGGFISLLSSTLVAVMSNFSSNNAVLGGVVYMNSNSKFTAVNSQFSANSAEIDGGVACVYDSSTFTATNSSFDSNSAKDDGGVAYVRYSSTFTATNSNFDSNSAENVGGVAVVQDSCTFTSINSSFGSNSAEGGGLSFVKNSSNFTATNSNFDSNSAELYGGVAYVELESTFAASNSNFDSNLVEFIGGVAFVHQSSTFTATNSNFSSNSAEVSGGVAFVHQSSTFTATNSNFESNFAKDQGGVAYVWTSSTFSATYSSFESNSAKYGGVAGVEDLSTFKPTNSNFESNSAKDRGGVAYVLTSSTFSATNSNFDSNSAEVAGGVAVVHVSSIFIAMNASFESNSADDGGVAFVHSSSTITAINSSFNSNRAADIGGVLILYDKSIFRATHSNFVYNSAKVVGGVAFVLESCRFGAANSVFDSNSAEDDGGVAYIAASSAFAVINSSIDSNFAEEYGGVATVADSSKFTATNSRFAFNSAKKDGGVAFVTRSSTFTATYLTFVSNSANQSGGVASVLSSSSFNATTSSFASNSAGRFGGVANIGVLSKCTVTNSNFDANSAGEGGGVGHISSFSTFLAKNSRFAFNAAENFGGVGGVAFVHNSSIFIATNSIFDSNSAEDYGGVIVIAGSSDFTGTNSTFDFNKSKRFGGVALVAGSSSITLTNSSFDSNSGSQGSSLYMRTSSVSEMSSLVLRNAQDFAFCDGTGTLTAAHLDLDASDQHFFLDESCLLTLYRVNNNGSEYFRSQLVEHVISESGTANIIQYSYPCKSGQWSTDGIEHGNTTDYEDANGITIDENDPFCDAGQLNTRIWNEAASCASSCATCPAGRYLPFTIDRYRHIGVESCLECPVGRYLSDDGSSEKWWLHDDLDDCAACPPGRFGDESGMAECHLCSPGSYSADSGSLFCTTAQAGHFVADVIATEDLPCPAGRYAAGSSSTECPMCEPGMYQPDVGQTSCIAATAGAFVANESATQEVKCPAGTFAAGSANAECLNCQPGTYQPDEGQTSCILAEPGYFVNSLRAVAQSTCATGTYSGTGASDCNLCDQGTFNNKSNQASCTRCPAPTTTTGAGRTFCDACLKGYFWNSLAWESSAFKIEQEESQCVECCVPCEDLCDIDDEACVDCSNGTAVLETLDVERGWWRATPQSLTVYECLLDRSCRGGSSVKKQCFEGHTGALCGACQSQFDYDVARNRCVKCRSSQAALKRIGNLAILITGIVMVLLIWLYMFYRPVHWTLFQIVLKDQVQEDVVGTGTELAVLEDMIDVLDAEQKNDVHNHSRQHTSNRELSELDCQALFHYVEKGPHDSSATARNNHQLSLNDEDPEDNGILAQNEDTIQEIDRHASDMAARKRFHKKLLTKIKIVVATWQISSACETILPQVHFPAMYEGVSRVFGIFGLSIFDIGSLKCLIGWTYFDKLIVVTICPLVVLAFGAVVFFAIQSYRGKLNTKDDVRHLKSNLTYTSLLFIYVCLPSISTTVLTFFSCRRFDRGHRSDLEVIITQLDIKCHNKRYNAWSVYCGIMILIWPVGFTCGLAVKLWCNRDRLNPSLAFMSEDRSKKNVMNRDSATEFWKEQHHRYIRALCEIEKIEIRANAKSISELEFFFEEYEPRCFLFPVFELARRLFLTSVLAVFYPGSAHQVAIGVLGALVSMAVYAYFEAYIQRHDNLVANVAQWQVALTYIASLIAFAADKADQKQSLYSSTKFGIIMLVILFSSFVVAVYVIVLDVFGYSVVDNKIQNMGCWLAKIKISIVKCLSCVKI